MSNIKQFLLVFVLSVMLYACSQPDGNHTGTEYMPDMGHSLAVEANTDNSYYFNTWDKESSVTIGELHQGVKEPVAGTVPRGYAGGALGASADMDVVLGNDNATNIRVTPNGAVPYYYADTEEERTRATAELIDNPFPITADGLSRGKELYNIFCATCHGEKANGLGYLYDTDQNPNAKYPLAPANLINEEFSAASNGRYYHALMYGKNAMGAYKDKINYEERWQVIHYIRSLQAKEAGAAYNEDENTYNAAFGVPAAALPTNLEKTAMMEETMSEADTPHTADDHHGADGEHHSDNHGGK